MWDIITRCWEQEPKDRPTTEIVLGLLRAKGDDTPVYLSESSEDPSLSSFVQLEAKKREQEEPHLFLTAKIITDETFANHEGFDLASFDEKNWPPSDLPTFRVLKQETYRVFKSRVAQHFGYPENQIRLWVLVNRQNKTVRPDAHIPENEPTLTVEVIRNNMAERWNDLRVYLEVIPDPTKPDPPSQSIMIFLKHFEASKQNLYGIGKTYVLRTSKVRDLIPIINERMRWTPGTPLKLFDEIKPGMIELLKPKYSFAQSEIQGGDIICFQVDLPHKEMYDLESQGLYPNPVLYYDFLQNRVMLIFKPKYDEVDQDHPEFKLVLSKKQNYDLMAAKVGEYLRHDAIKLRFTTTHASNGAAKSILKRSLNQSIAEIMAPCYINPSTAVMLYEKLDISIVELETKRSFKVTWTGVHNKEEAIYPFLLSKTNNVHELAEHLAKKVVLTQGGTGKMRIFEISKNGKMQKEFAASEFIGNFPDPVDLYAEEISREEWEADDWDKVISVFHFSKDLSRTHGVPFKFVVKRDERFFDTKKRLQARLELSDEEIATYRFALIQPSVFKQPSYIEEDDILYEHPFAPEDVLGLDHVDKFGESRSAREKAIVIRG
ncbi:ICP0-binding domain of Ubiquitin-specific protease 7 domain containing protein [Amanita muscaria]